MAECANCDKRFRPKHDAHQVCDDCYWAWRRRDRWATCADCGAEFPQERPEHEFCHRYWRDRRPLFPYAERRFKAMFELEYLIAYTVVAVVVLVLYGIRWVFGWW